MNWLRFLRCFYRFYVGFFRFLIGLLPKPHCRMITRAEVLEKINAARKNAGPSHPWLGGIIPSELMDPYEKVKIVPYKGLRVFLDRRIWNGFSELRDVEDTMIMKTVRRSRCDEYGILDFPLNLPNITKHEKHWDHIAFHDASGNPNDHFERAKFRHLGFDPKLDSNFGV